MVFIVDWTWSVMKRMEKLSREELKTIENDISAARRAGVEVKHSDGEIPIMGIKRYGRWYDATLVNPQFILAQRRLIRMRREGIDYDTTEEDDLSIIAVELSFVDLQCMCRFSVRDASEDELMPPPPPPMPECGLEDRDESEVELMPPPPPPPMPECGLEEAKKRRRRGGRRHKNHRRA